MFEHDGDGGDEGFADVFGALFGGFSVVHGGGEFDALAVPFAILEPQDDLVMLGDSAGAAEDGGREGAVGAGFRTLFWHRWSIA